MLENSKIKTDFVLVIGMRVVHIAFGAGSVTDVECNEDGRQVRFCIEFDNGEEKVFGFPAVFHSGLVRMESGEEVHTEVEKTDIVKKQQLNVKGKTYSGIGRGKQSYEYWTDRYPNHVVIRQEGDFYRCRGESAKTVNRVLGYRLGGDPGYPVTGTQNLEVMLMKLNKNEVSYIVIEDGEIVDQEDY